MPRRRSQGRLRGYRRGNDGGSGLLWRELHLQKLIRPLIITALLSPSVAGCADGEPDQAFPPSEADDICREASWVASYSEDYDAVTVAMDYFIQHCTWDGDEPVVRKD